MKKLATLAALAGALTMAATAPAQAEMKSAGKAEQCVEGKCLKTKAAEGKCGEGKCGEGKCGAHDHKAKAAEGKCGSK
ncbi:oxazolone/thioamide-modified RiPP metallophore HvfA [Pasteurella multocida]